MIDWKHILPWALFAGLAMVGVQGLAFFLEPRWLFSLVVYWGSTLLLVICMSWACARLREQKDDFGIRDGLKVAFGVFVGGSIAYHLFFNVLVYYIDPGLLDLQREVMAQSLEEWGLSAEEASKLPESFEIGPALFSLAQGLIVGFLLSLPVAWIMRKG